MLITQSYLTFCDPMKCSLPGSSVHGILQAKILEWVAISFSSHCYNLFNYSPVYGYFFPIFYCCNSAGRITLCNYNFCMVRGRFLEVRMVGQMINAYVVFFDICSFIRYSDISFQRDITNFHYHQQFMGCLFPSSLANKFIILLMFVI